MRALDRSYKDSPPHPQIPLSTHLLASQISKIPLQTYDHQKYLKSLFQRHEISFASAHHFLPEYPLPAPWET